MNMYNRFESKTELKKFELFTLFISFLNSKMIKSFSIVSFLILVVCFQGFSQIDYSIKAETSFIKFLYNPIIVEAAEGWKGYNLDSKNGVEITMSNGLLFKKKTYTGIGISYLNFEGTNGLAIYSDFDFISRKRKAAPLGYVKIGYSHLWNQYENGTGTLLVEFGYGYNYQLTDSFAIYLKAGILLTQQSFLIPIRLGVRF